MTWIIIWVVYGLVGLTIELYAVFNKTGGDTLSEQVWKFEGIKGYVVTHSSLRRMVLVGGAAILAAHLWTGWI